MRLGLARRRRGARRRGRAPRARRGPTTAPSTLLVAPMVTRHARAHRRPRTRPAVRPVRDARHRRHARRGARRRRVPARAARRASTPTSMIDDLATPGAARPVPRRARRRPRRARAPCCSASSRLADGAARRRVGRRQPADRRRRPPGRGRRAGRARDASTARAATRRRRHFRRCSSRAASIVAGASSHPGQVRVRRAAQHPRRGLRGRGRARRTSRAATVLGRRHRRDVVDDLPDGAVRPRVRVHAGGARTPSCSARARAGACAPRSSPRAGYGEAGDDGPRAPRHELVALADELGILLAGPNGQGVVSTPASLCAQIVAPYPPPGRIGDREPVGQLRVVVPELRGRRPASGVSRAVSAGQRGGGRRRRLPRVLRRRPGDRGRASRTSRASPTAARSSTGLRARSPRASRVVLVKGGDDRGRPARGGVATPGRSPATTASSTGMCRQAGVTRAATDRGGVRGRGDVRDPAAARGTRASRWSPPPAAGASSPPTRSRRVRRSSSLPLPDDLRAAIDEKLPPRWSRNNPIDLAGGETRDTIPEVLELVAAPSRRRRDRVPRPRHPVEPGPPDARRAASTRTTGSSASSPTTSARTRGSRRPRPTISDATGKPILTATELAVADPDNAGPARRSARPAASATRRRTARSPRSGTCGATRATGDALEAA